MLKDQLLLVVGLENHGILVETFDLSNQFYTADQKNGDWGFIAANCIEVNILDILGRCFVFHRNSLKIYELFEKLTDLVFNLLTISGSIKPTNIGLFAKPSHLTFSVVSSITLDYTNRVVFGDTGIEIRNDMTVPDGLKRLGAGWKSAAEKLPDFTDQSSLEHVAHANIDPPVKLVSRGIQTDKVHLKAHQRLPWTFSKVFRKRTPGLQPDFKRPNDFRLVAFRNSGGRFRIQLLKKAVKVTPPFPLRQHLQTIPPIHGPGGAIEEPFRQCSQVQPRPSDQDRQLATTCDLLEDLPRFALIVAGGEDFVRFANVDHVMRNPLPLLGRRLRAPDI
jgi:hypothetical protein